MDYYHCTIEQLYQEIQRRGYTPAGTCDQLSESLKKDDEIRGADATTVKTESSTYSIQQEVSLFPTTEFAQSARATLLVNQKIVHWTMNTFFPSLQLFFESGLSCTIASSRLPDAIIGLDQRLRFRLTDCTHEENGRLVRTILPERFACSRAGIKIEAAVVTQRTSIAAKPEIIGDKTRRPSPHTDGIVEEMHIVVGLRLEGMNEMGYVWAKTRAPFEKRHTRTWGDVRLGRVRGDVPVPFVGFPQRVTKAGGEVTVVAKKSMVSAKVSKDDRDDRGYGNFLLPC